MDADFEGNLSYESEFDVSSVSEGSESPVAGGPRPALNHIRRHGETYGVVPFVLGTATTRWSFGSHPIGVHCELHGPGCKWDKTLKNRCLGLAAAWTRLGHEAKTRSQHMRMKVKLQKGKNKQQQKKWKKWLKDFDDTKDLFEAEGPPGDGSSTEPDVVL